MCILKSGFLAHSVLAGVIMPASFLLRTYTYFRPKKLVGTYRYFLLSGSKCPQQFILDWKDKREALGHKNRCNEMVISIRTLKMNKTDDLKLYRTNFSSSYLF